MSLAFSMMCVFSKYYCNIDSEKLCGDKTIKYGCMYVHK